MWMTQKLDEGPVFASLDTAIGPEEDAGSLSARLAELGADCLSGTLARIGRGEIVREAQDSSRATYAPKFGREDARLTLDQDAASFTRMVRAFAPEPGAFLDLERDVLQILAASPGPSGAAGEVEGLPGAVLGADRERGLHLSLGSGSVWLRTVRPSGRKAVSGYDYANGARLKPGILLRAKGAGA